MSATQPASVGLHATGLPVIGLLATGLLVLVACGPATTADPPPRVVEVPAAPASASAAEGDAAPPARASSEPSNGDAEPPVPPKPGPITIARIVNAEAEALAIASAVELWMMQNGGGACPRHEDLVAAQVVPPESTGLDPWHQPYAITCTDDGAIVTSRGPDRREGTADDVASRRP